MKYSAPANCVECHDPLREPRFYDKHLRCADILFYTNTSYIPLVANSENPKNPKELFGIELEMPFSGFEYGEGEYNPSDDEKALMAKLRDLKIPADLGYDGGGIEFRFYPMTFKAYTEQRKTYAKLLNFLTEIGATPHNGAGIHIHISKTAFDTDQHLYKFLKLLYRNKKPVTQLAGRTTSYASFTGKRLKFLQTRATTTLSPQPRQEDFPTPLEYWTTVHNRNATLGQKFWAVNTRHYKTIEVRLFKTTNKLTIFYAYIQFLKAAIDFSRKFDSGAMKWNDFNSFVGRKRTFKDLRNLIEERVVSS